MPGLEVRDRFGVYIAGNASPEVLATANLDAARSAPQEPDRLAHADLARWAPIVKASGFGADGRMRGWPAP